MKNDVSKLFVLTALVAVLALAAPADAQRRASAQVGANCTGGLQALFDQTEVGILSETEVEAVTYLREEEKLARDVYLKLAERWQLPIFANIAAAEQRHMDLVAQVLELYGIADPIVDDTVGAFTDTELAGFFNDFVDAGDVSLIDALTVGATIEDMDLADLQVLIGFATNDHLKLVAYNLAKGSRNHLRAFVRALAAQDATYAPQFLTEAEFEAVFEAEMEVRVYYNADGEPVPACGAGIGGFGMRRGPGQGGQQGSGSDNGNGPGGNGHGGNGDNGNGDGTGNGHGTGSGTGTCDGTGSGTN